MKLKGDRPWLWGIALGTVLALASSPRAERLADLLAAVATNERFDSPARADVRIACEPDCTPAATRAIFLGRGDTLYVELEGGLRALIRPGEILTLEHGRAAPAPPGAALGDTNVLLEDLAPFTPGSLKLPQISDEGPTEIVVTAAPSGPSAYVLLVRTIDPRRHLVLKTQYYRELIGNLAAMRRDGGFVDLAGHPRPGEITVQSFRRGTTTRLVLSWRAAPDAPDRLFQAQGLAEPSGLAWPDAR